MSIPLIDSAFLPEFEYELYIIETSGIGLALFIQLYIGALAYSKTSRSESIHDRHLVFLFFLSFVCAVLCTGLLVTAHVIYISYDSHPAYAVTITIVPIFYSFFCDIVLLTLVTRLYLTFRATALQMTANTVYLFSILFMLLVVLNILSVVGNTFIVYDEEDIGWLPYVTANVLGLFVYVAGCALAVGLFVTNLSNIAKTQAETCVDLSPKQRTLLHLSAKYILLFFVASLSTGFTVFFSYIVSFEFRGLFASVDMSVSFLCLYLQFGFAEENYQKWCGCLDSRSRMVVEKRAERDMQRESVTMHKELAMVVVSSVSSESSTNSV